MLLSFALKPNSRPLSSFVSLSIYIFLRIMLSIKMGIGKVLFLISGNVECDV